MSETAIVAAHRPATTSELLRASARCARAAINRPKRAKAVRRRLVSSKSMTMNRCGWVEDGTSPSSSASNGGGRRGFGSRITCAHSSPRVAHESTTAAQNRFLLTARLWVVIGRYPAGPSLRWPSRSSVLFSRAERLLYGSIQQEGRGAALYSTGRLSCSIFYHSVVRECVTDVLDLLALRCLETEVGPARPSPQRLGSRI
jgi:hypothetical protein